MNYPIIPCENSPSRYDELLLLWEESVRSTHHFLKEEDIQFFKPLIRSTYFQAVQLYIIENEKKQIVAFMGVSEDAIEMLFVRPGEQGKGYGKELTEFAIQSKRIRKVDVNEQNEAAYHFYRNRGFEVAGRDETDGTGKPYPILHLQQSPIRLREANEDDLETLHRIFEASVTRTCHKDYTSEQINAWIRRADRDRWQTLFESDLQFILAEDTQTFSAAGFISVSSEGYLHSLFVHPDYQHRHVASLLLAKAEEKVWLTPASSLYSEVSITARPFFEKHGYLVEKEQTVTVNGVQLINFVMRKLLH